MNDLRLYAPRGLSDSGTGVCGNGQALRRPNYRFTLCVTTTEQSSLPWHIDARVGVPFGIDAAQWIVAHVIEARSGAAALR